MHEEPIRPPDRTPQDADDAIQSAVLAHLLDAAPAQLSTDERLRELTSDPDSFEERDALVRAVRDLDCAGLLHRHGEFVFPTRAARRFSELPSL